MSASQTIHHFPGGPADFVGHDRQDCPCKPTRTVEYKRNGTKQGYTVVEHWNHHELPKEKNL